MFSIHKSNNNLQYRKQYFTVCESEVDIDVGPPMYASVCVSILMHPK